MNDIDIFVEDTLNELERRVSDQENEFLDLFLTSFVSEFYVDDTFIKNTEGNYVNVAKVNRMFDDAYEAFIIPFLLWYGKKLVEASEVSLAYFLKMDSSIKHSKDVAKLIGLNGDKITKGGFLWNLGRMSELRQRLQNMVMTAIASTQKLSVFIRNLKPLLKSSKTNRSAIAKYYLKYAYEPIMHVLNSTSYEIAKRYGYTHFLYAGGLVEKSRDFCIERAGNVYTIEEGKEWNSLNWHGKIQGVDFFTQIAGYNCLHHLEYQKLNDNE